jgi:hypothetical protein
MEALRGDPAYARALVAYDSDRAAGWPSPGSSFYGSNGVLAGARVSHGASVSRLSGAESNTYSLEDGERAHRTTSRGPKGRISRA